MSKGLRIKEQHTAEKLPDGVVKLSKTEIGALAFFENRYQRIAEGKAQAQDHILRMDAQKEMTDKERDLVLDEICAAHGVIRGNRQVIVSKDLTTFTLGEEHAQGNTESKSAAPLIVTPGGQPAERPLIPGELRPSEVLGLVEGHRNA